jgi:hypothetical protein
LNRRREILLADLFRLEGHQMSRSVSRAAWARNSRRASG